MHKVLVLALAAASILGAAAVRAEDVPAPALPAQVTAPAVDPTKEPVDLPVLISPKNINEPITADDLTIQSFPIKKVHGDMIRDSSQIIGLAAKRPLQAGQPMRFIDLMKEQLVKHGDDVTLVYHTGALEITASGRALESGALNDSIKITNLGSNRTVDAKVIGPKQVEIRE